MNIATRKFDIHQQPMVIKVAIILTLCLIGVWGGGFFVLVADKNSKLNTAEMQEEQFKNDIKAKQSQMLNLDVYQTQIEETRSALFLQLQQLPRESEIAELLSDISRAGLANDLVFDLFEPGEEKKPKKADFYAELPITIKVTGNYHQLGQFISEISSLPRIVTLHDLTLKPAPAGSKKDRVSMEVFAKTYYYLTRDSKDI